ncbi:MAG: hypothetical protein Q8K65_00655 [Alphaproteobacteria bacterium]|nr:hypothetical protein [Alphaproteobacteria bacterium]
MKASVKAFFGVLLRPALWVSLPLCGLGFALAALLLLEPQSGWHNRDLMPWAVVLAGAINVFAMWALCRWENFRRLFSNTVGAERAGVYAFIIFVLGMLCFGSGLRWLAAQAVESLLIEWHLFFPLAGLVWGAGLAGALHATVTGNHHARYVIWAGLICLLLLFGGY